MIDISCARLLPIAALCIGAIGCESDSTVATTKDPDEDQALALSVLGARGDTLATAVENEVIVDTGLPPDLRPVAPAPQPTVAATPSFSPAVVRAAPAPAPSRRHVEPQVSPPPESEQVVAQATPRRPRPLLRRAPARENIEVSSPSRIGIISRGATFSLVTARAVCNDDAAVGNTFRVVITDAVRGSNGVVIPSGAQAVAEVASVDKWGAGIGVRVKSVRFNGRSYPVTSRVGYVLPVGGNSGACIPRRARLDVETKEPIRVASSN